MAFGISNNNVDVSKTDWAKEGQRVVRLSPDDPFYQDVRDLHIDQLGPYLQDKAMQVQQTYAEKDDLKKKQAKEMGEYVKKFTNARQIHELLQTHINLAHDLKSLIERSDFQACLRLEDEITAQSGSGSLDLVEDQIDDQKPLHEVLRLLTLHSLVHNGIKPKQLDAIKKAIIQSYGYEHLLTLMNM